MRYNQVKASPGDVNMGDRVEEKEPLQAMVTGIDEEKRRYRQPVSVVILGASGDLTQRKLVPALHTLGCEGFLPDDFQVVGVARSPLSEEAFRSQLFRGVEAYSRAKPGVCALWHAFGDRVSYLSGDYDDPETYRRLADRLAHFERGAGMPGNRLFYLATPPSLYPVVVRQLGEAGLNCNAAGWAHVIIEKPFGHDLESARGLNEQVHGVFEEGQVYRIDHYLGKETVQNILALRFANAIFEPLWNRNYIDHVQISVTETVGVEHRAGYYDQTGVLRDMFQNHVLQLLTLTAMEPPAMFEAGALRDEKAKVLRALRRCMESVRAQYRGYRAEEGVARDSQTPTFAALKCFVDNWRWQGVPFYLRSGKRLAGKTTEISIQFKEVPHLLFPPSAGANMAPNVLSLCLQPGEGIHLRFEAKEPGAGMRTRSVDMDFHYAEDLSAAALPEAYERLLLDAIHGDASLFARADEIELAWQVVDPILATWAAPGAPELALYEEGSDGPPEADELLGREGRAWHHDCGDHSR